MRFLALSFILLGLTSTTVLGASRLMEQCRQAFDQSPLSYENIQICAEAGADLSLSNSDRSRAWNNLASRLGTLEKWQEMLAASETAVQLDPGRYWEAVGAAEHALRLNPDSSTGKLARENRKLAQAAMPNSSRRRFTVQNNKYAVAVIIGNKTYSGKIPEVSFAHNDADAMRKFVIEGLGYREGNIIDLRDTTRAELDVVFGDDRTHEGKLFDWVRPGKSDVVVFYSGHGVPGLKDKRAYLLPVDGDANRAEITGFPVATLYRNLAKLPAKSVRVFIDACFSGETPKGMVIRAASGISVVPKMPKSAKRLVTVTAAQGDQLASWDEDAKMGLFTKHLLEALYGAADGGDYGDGDGRVSVAEVGNYLDSEMSYQARRRFGRVQKASLSGEASDILVPKILGNRMATKVKRQTAKPEPNAQVRPPQPAKKSTEELFWSTIKNSTDIENFKAYLAQFPNGTFVTLARIKIRKLTGRQTAAVQPARPAPVQTKVNNDLGKWSMKISPPTVSGWCPYIEDELEIDFTERGIQGEGGDSVLSLEGKLTDDGKVIVGRLFTNTFVGNFKLSKKANSWRGEWEGFVDNTSCEGSIALSR